MTDTLLITGLACIAVGMFMVAVYAGMLTVGGGLVLMSWALTREKRAKK